MNRIHIVILLLALGAGGFFAGNAAAQQPATGGLQISGDQKLLFEAAKKVMSRDFKGAEDLYSQALSINKSNIDAYLQRGVVRRELGDAAGVASDGQATVTLANMGLKNNPNDPNLYYKRGMGFRLLKNYDQAEKDISAAIGMGGQPTWQTDLQAIKFERKEEK